MDDLTFRKLVEDVKQRNPIEAVIGEKYTLTTSGNIRHNKDDSSFTVNVRMQLFGQWGTNGAKDEDKFGKDVIAWIRWRDNCDLRTAIETLCRRANMPSPDWQDSPEAAARALAQQANEDALTCISRLWARWLRASDKAKAYCEDRGWDVDSTMDAEGKVIPSTVQLAELGFSGSGTSGERKQLIECLEMNGIAVDNNGAKAMMTFPSNFLIYPHISPLNHRVNYVSGRLMSHEDKKILREKGIHSHHNPPEDLIGEKQFYFNFAYDTKAELVVMVEGQADAVTLGKKGIASVALLNCKVDEKRAGELFGELKKRHTAKGIVFFADNQPPSAWDKFKALAALVGPTSRLFRLIA